MARRVEIDPLLAAGAALLEHGLDGGGESAAPLGP